MLKAFKILLFAGLYKKAKRNFLILFASIIALLLINLMISDAVDVSSGMSIYFLLTMKWLINLSLLWSIGFNILKVFNVLTNPFSNNEPSKTQESSSKKKHILNKEKLFTQSDLILQKYMKD